MHSFKIPRSLKRIFNLTGGIFLSACCFFGSYLNFTNGWTDLSKVSKYQELIIEKGITSYQTRTSGPFSISLTKQAFFFKLKGLDQILAVYNPSQSYSSLDNNLNVGDSIRVFYNHSNMTDKINLKTFQIEKNNNVILSSEDLQGRERMAFYITFSGGLLLLFLTFYQDKRFRTK